MIDLIRLVFPYFLILYFVLKGIKEPFYLLGIPFLMFMSESIFFDGVKIFQIPGSLVYGLKFIWLVIVWIVAKILERDKDKNGITNVGRLNELDYIIIAFLVISFVGLGISILNYSILTGVFKEFISLISLFVCYFIIKSWSSNNDPELLVDFLYSLVVINSIASVFYVLHQGLHVKIYNLIENSAEIFQGEAISRTFWFMPQFLPFSIAFLLVFKERRPKAFYLLMLMNLFAIYVSYTRSSIIITFTIILFYYMFVGLKNGRVGLFFRKVLISGLLVIMGFIILSKVFPANTNYFVNRFSDLTESSATSGPNNLEFRFIMSGIIISNIDENDKIIGMGSVTKNQMPWVPAMQAATADMVWTGVIFRWGFVGLVLFILLYIFSLIKAYLFYMSSEGVFSDLALMFLLYIFSQILESFVSWTFMSDHGLATGLWYFAMLSALIGFKQNNRLLLKEKLANE